MSGQHTPGPWRLSTTDDTKIVDVEGDDIAGTIGCYSLEWEAMEANARLIAAAPELLEALEDWLHDYTTLTAHEWSNRYRTFRDRVHRTAAIIAKAKGQSA